MVENEYGKSGNLSIFTFLKHLMNAFEVQFFQGFIFTPYQRQWLSRRAMQLRFSKVETLFIIAFKKEA